MACAVCGLLARDENLATYIAHLRERHESDKWKISCIIKSCIWYKRPFKSFRSFYNHCIGKHPASNISSNIAYCASDSSTAKTDVRAACDTSDAFKSERSDVLQPDAVNTDHAIKTTSPMLATKIFHLKVIHQIPQVAISSLVQELQTSFSNMRLDVLKASAAETVDNTIDADTFKNIVNGVFGVNSKDLDCVRTTYSQKRHLAAQLSYAEPHEMLLGRTLHFITSKSGKRSTAFKNHNMYYVSVGETLKLLYRDTSFQNLLSSQCHSSNDSLLTRFEDGKYYREHFSASKNPLHLILYYDDIEICNPLGSHTKVHKLGMFYFTLTCIPPEYRSRLKSIFLLGVAYYNDIKRYGIDTILKPFYQEMEQLSNEGIELIHKNHNIFKCYLAIVTADTPAANLITGYKEGVGFAYRKCRHCMATSDSIDEYTHEEDFELRTRSSHETQAMGGFWTSTDSGINRRSALLDVPHFDMFTCVPQDTMHILLEGVIPRTVKLVLNYLISVEKCFTLEQLNYQIQHFPYSMNDGRDKPAMITPQHLLQSGTLRQSSSRMWCLFRLLPLMIRDYVKNWDCQPLQCLTSLMEISAIMMSPRIPTLQTSYLEILIEFYLTEFKASFPTVALTPKQHYLVHIPSQIRDLGPPVGYWCMRFEGKHATFKNSIKSGLFKNVAKALALRHQQSFAAHCLKKDLFAEDIKLSAKKPVDSDILQLVPDNSVTSHHISACKYASINGVRFVINSLVLLDSDNHMPKFGQLVSILIGNDIIMFLIEHLSCIGLDESLYCYICRKNDPPSHELIKYQDLLYFDCLSCYTLGNNMYVPQKVDYCCISEK